MIKNVFLFLIAAFIQIQIFAETTTVVVAGSAEGDPGKAGELALTDALRNAVRKGAGVDVLSESKVTNFQSDYDVVMTSSIGYIESYKILEQKYSKSNGIYTVKIEAVVSNKTPESNKVMALRLLMKRMESPRVTVECKEKIKGIDDSEVSLCAGVIDEMAQKNGFELFDQGAIDSRSSIEAARAEILGDALESKVKKAGITSSSDFKIIADIKGSVGKIKEPFPEVYVRDAAVGIDLKAVWTDTGEIIATVSVPTKNFKGEANMSLPYEMPDQLIRYYLTNILEGKEKGTEDKSIYKLFSKVIAKWITELDLGSKIKLEFKAIDKNRLDELVSKLKDLKGVSYAWRREYDKRLYSIVEVETRFNASQLEDAVLKIVNVEGGKDIAKYEVDQATKKSLRFIPNKL